MSDIEEGFPEPEAYISTPASPSRYAGMLFPSFDDQANYEAKRNQLLQLGYSLDVTPTASGGKNGPLDGEDEPGGGGGNDPSQARRLKKEMKTLTRQLLRRETMFAAAQRRAVNEAKRYAEVVSHLRSEGKRKDEAVADAHSSLVAQLEALHYVEQRRKDAERRTTEVRYQEVDLECAEDLTSVSDELSKREKHIALFGRDRLALLQRMATCDSIEFVSELTANQTITAESEQVRAVALEQCRSRVDLAADSWRSRLFVELSASLRAEYLIDGPNVTPSTSRLLSDRQGLDLTGLLLPLQEQLQGIGQEAEADAMKSGLSFANSTEARVRRVLTDRARVVAEDTLQKLDTEAIVLSSHLAHLRESNLTRRQEEEEQLRLIVLQSSKLLEAQRSATHALRTQLLTAAKSKKAANSPRRNGNATSSSPTKRRANSTGASTKGSASGNVSRKIYEPLTPNQLRSLYGPQPTPQSAEERNKRKSYGAGNNVVTQAASPSRNNKQNLGTPSHLRRLEGHRLSTPKFQNTDDNTLQELRRLRAKGTSATDSAL